MAEHYGISIEEIFDSMESRFLSDRAQGVAATIGYKIYGTGGGAWQLLIDNGKMKLEKGTGTLDKCNVVIATDAETFAGINLGKITADEALASGKLSIKGDALLMSSVLPKVFRAFCAVPTTDSQQSEELLRLSVVTSVAQRFATGPVMGRWFKGLKEKKFMANKCPQCGRTQIPPREICADCRVVCPEFIEVGPEATVTAIDKVFYASPDPLTGKVRETPYASFFMVLDGSSPTESLNHEIKKEDFLRLQKGSRVRPVWAEHTTGSFKDLLYFEIVD